MSVATHLAIDLEEYDARIRTFIPYYEEMLEVAASLVSVRRPHVVVDLGTGTGALAGRIARLVRGVCVVGIDEDEGMISAATRRLPERRTTFVHGSFLREPLPQCDAFTASFALHHVALPRAKRDFFGRARAALRPGGALVSADCHPSSVQSLAGIDHRAWQAFLATTYGPSQARRYLSTWAKEDFYTTLPVELDLLKKAGFTADVVWRRQSFAVILAE